MAFAAESAANVVGPTIAAVCRNLDYLDYLDQLKTKSVERGRAGAP
jgi:hypothetical protein